MLVVGGHRKVEGGTVSDLGAVRRTLCLLHMIEMVRLDWEKEL